MESKDYRAVRTDAQAQANADGFDRGVERWSMDGIAKATDGCTVEPDGTCEHGAKSWLLIAGVI